MSKKPESTGEPVKTSNVDMSDQTLLDRLKEEQTKYPAWGPEKAGAILAGKIEDFKAFPFMHQGKGSMYVLIDTGLDGINAKIAWWLNVVGQSQLLKIYNSNLAKGEEPVEMEAEFDVRAEAIQSLIGTEIIVQYQGEEKSSDKAKAKLNPYQKYTVVRK